MLELTAGDYRAIAGSRFYATKVRGILAGMVLLVLWAVTLAILYTPERQDTVYVAPSGVEAVKPYGKGYIVVDRVVWPAEEKDSPSPPSGLLFLPLLLLAGGMVYLLAQEDKAKNKMVDENFVLKDS